MKRRFVFEKVCNSAHDAFQEAHVKMGTIKDNTAR